MKPSKKILIAIDYAPSAQQIAEQGYELSKQLHAEVIILHVIEDINDYSLYSYDPIMGFGGFIQLNFMGVNALAEVEREATVYLDKTKLHLQDKTIQTKVVHGESVQAILDVALQLGVNYLVVGAHSKKNLDDMRVGHTTSHLLKHATIPIICIPTSKIN
jgi:nucleotide-binding universal stress UspA family protein